MSIPKVVTTITCEMDLRCELFSMGIPVRLVLFFFPLLRVCHPHVASFSL